MSETNTMEQNLPDDSGAKKKNIFRKFLLPAIIGIVLIGSGVGYYFYSQYKTNQADPQATAQKEVQSLLAQVSKLIILPQNETPTVATVSDPEKLKGQAFFINAQQGDKVLIYSTSKKAILYRPSAKKIIEVAPINLGSGPAPQASDTSASQTPTAIPKIQTR